MDHENQHSSEEEVFTSLSAWNEREGSSKGALEDPADFFEKEDQSIPPAVEEVPTEAPLPEGPPEEVKAPEETAPIEVTPPVVEEVPEVSLSDEDLLIAFNKRFDTNLGSLAELDLGGKKALSPEAIEQAQQEEILALSAKLVQIGYDAGTYHKIQEKLALSPEERAFSYYKEQQLAFAKQGGYDPMSDEDIRYRFNVEFALGEEQTFSDYDKAVGLSRYNAYIESIDAGLNGPIQEAKDQMAKDRIDAQKKIQYKTKVDQYNAPLTISVGDAQVVVSESDMLDIKKEALDWQKSVERMLFKSVQSTEGHLERVFNFEEFIRLKSLLKGKVVLPSSNGELTQNDVDAAYQRGMAEGRGQIYSENPIPIRTELKPEGVVAEENHYIQAN